jgi:hypothetical protein
MGVDLKCKRIRTAVLAMACLFSGLTRADDYSRGEQPVRSECSPVNERHLEGIWLAFYGYAEIDESARRSGKTLSTAYLIQWPTADKIEIFQYVGTSLRLGFESISEFITRVDPNAVGYALMWRDRLLTNRKDDTHGQTEPTPIVRINYGMQEGPAYEAYFSLERGLSEWNLVEMGCGINLLSLRKNIADASHSATSSGGGSNSMNWTLMRFPGQAADEADTPLETE